MKSLSFVLSVLVLLFVSLSVQAVSFTVKNDGPVNAYFAGSSADYSSDFKVIIGNGDPEPFTHLFSNHSSSVGDKIELGNFSAGDYFIPVLQVITTGDFFWSNPKSNSDGLNHVFASSFQLPDGTSAVLIGFEDIRGGGDLDFNDHMAIFTNIEIAPVPEPETYLMLLIGLLLVIYVVRKRGIGGSGSAV
ncbi:DUF4114 domain-containing protein [Nitrosomonas ureae]|uniref:PEP-CTERM protein-sorting domain-containing protein n=1 Tax=Nitrosomonas ureae TaxID=44577 RepID=A0A286A290_9PROT|nr:DUF4114 domain-containing protein [Nitrosomonas ureae]SOD15971.1 PEP-CTERM protein-sorting domain-containing protein [Nitrosomonas ureae]